MTDSSASTLKESLAPSSAPRSSSPSKTTESKKWYDKFKSAPEVPGKEKWRDASLSEKERWKEWHKAKDLEKQRGSTAGYYTTFYKAKGGWAWWLGSLS